MRVAIGRRFIFAFAVILLVSQWQIAETAASSKQDDVATTPTPTDETTTKKSGLFSGFKKFFSRSSTTTPAPIEQTSSTTAKATPTTTTTPAKPTTKPTAATANSNSIPTTKNPAPLPGQSQPGFGAGGRPSPGFPQPLPKKPIPSGFDLSYGGGEVRPTATPISVLTRNDATSTTTVRTPTTKDINTPKTAPLPTPISVLTRNDATSTTTARTPTTKDINTPKTAPLPNSSSGPTFATTKHPQIPKDDFPPLPSPKHSPDGTFHTSTTPSTATKATAWKPINTPQPGAPVPFNPPASQPTAPNGVSFVPNSPSGGSTIPTNLNNNLASDDEIRQITEDLYSKETASQMSRIHVHLQGKTRSIDSTDEAPQPLLEVDEKAFETLSIVKLRALFNNYEMDAAVNEYVSPREREEENDFVDTISKTKVIERTMNFLQTKGIVTSDPKTHKDLLKELWFTQYPRISGKVGSSGFEHVFANEVKNGTIIGLHNWVYFYEQEKAGKLDYKGYLKSEDLGEKGKIVKVRFTHNGNNKPVNTLFVGTSPELEIALYTLCFELRPGRTCSVSLGGTKFAIVTYPWRRNGKDLIGSAFPEI